ncbi:MAG: FliH/SctL family protein [Thermoleophilaceae bacterium]
MDAFAFEQLAPAAPTVERAGAALDDETIATLRAAVQAESVQAAEALRADAREQGRREGLEAARVELESAAQALAAALAEVAEERRASTDVLEREAVELALHIAEKVLCGTLEVQPERVLDVVRGSLRRVVDRERVTVLVNPGDLELVRDAAGSLTGALGGMGRLEICEERRVAPGGCVLRTVDGEIDARVGEQLDRARELMEAELGG